MSHGGTMDKPEVDHAKEQAQAQLESIMAMVKELDAADDLARDTGKDEAREAAEQVIREDALSVEVRSGWVEPGAEMKAEEYCLLLCTGGPAVRLRGTLTEHQEPEDAVLEYQDWGTPWTAYRLSGEEEAACVTYAQQFYFGS